MTVTRLWLVLVEGFVSIEGKLALRGKFAWLRLFVFLCAFKIDLQDFFWWRGCDSSGARRVRFVTGVSRPWNKCRLGLYEARLAGLCLEQVVTLDGARARLIFLFWPKNTTCLRTTTSAQVLMNLWSWVPSLTRKALHDKEYCTPFCNIEAKSKLFLDFCT